QRYLTPKLGQHSLDGEKQTLIVLLLLLFNKMETLTEALETQHQNLIHYDRMLNAREVSLEEVGRICPDILHFNDSDYNFQFLNQKACEWFCLPKEQILKMGNGFIQEFYHPDTVKNEFPRIKQFYAKNDEGIVYSNYHQIYNPSIKSFSICLVFIRSEERRVGNGRGT